MQTTLVLDHTYRPINVVPWPRAVSYLVRDRCDLLEEYEQDVHFNMGMPAVVRLKRPIQVSKQRIRFSRQNVLARDRFRCQYCGAKGKDVTLTFDHVVPKSRGGKTCWENIVLACSECNHRKANKTPREAGMRLRTTPVRPTWVPSFNLALRNPLAVPPEWKDYWIAELQP